MNNATKNVWLACTFRLGSAGVTRVAHFAHTFGGRVVVVG